MKASSLRCDGIIEAAGAGSGCRAPPSSCLLRSWPSSFTTGGPATNIAEYGVHNRIWLAQAARAETCDRAEPEGRPRHTRHVRRRVPYQRVARAQGRLAAPWFRWFSQNRRRRSLRSAGIIGRRIMRHFLASAASQRSRRRSEPPRTESSPNTTPYGHDLAAAKTRSSPASGLSSPCSSIFGDARIAPISLKTLRVDQFVDALANGEPGPGRAAA